MQEIDSNILKEVHFHIYNAEWVNRSKTRVTNLRNFNELKWKDMWKIICAKSGGKCNKTLEKEVSKQALTLNSKQQSLSIMGNSSQRVWWLRLRDLRKDDHEEEGGTAVTGTWAVRLTTLRHHS